MKRVLAIILGGGAGTRLYPLTKLRAKPAVPLGAKYRLIDIPISNCINSEIHRIYVLTQFNSASLNRHIARTYALAGAGFSQALSKCSPPSKRRTARVGLKARRTPCASICGYLRSGMSISTSFCPAIICIA